MRLPADGARDRGAAVSADVSVEKFVGADVQRAVDSLAVEEPLEIQLVLGPANARQRKSIAVTMRTPGDDLELAVGFLMTEGVIRDSADIVQASSAGQIEPNVIRIELMPDVAVSVGNLERNFYTTSSCGVCGKSSILALRTVGPPRTANRFQVMPELVSALPDRLRTAQDGFGRTGGLHAAGLFDLSGNLLSSREDVGRHNAVDKLLGVEFLADRTPLRDRMLMLSGRSSFELLQKAVMGGLPMVVSVGAPSTLALQVAREFEVTLVGFVRADHFNVYCGEERIAGARNGGHGANG